MAWRRNCGWRRGWSSFDDRPDKYRRRHGLALAHARRRGHCASRLVCLQRKFLIGALRSGWPVSSLALLCCPGRARRRWPGRSDRLLFRGACLAWGLDNNLTRKVSLADPLQIVEIKGLTAGPVNLLLGISTRRAPEPADASYRRCCRFPGERCQDCPVCSGVAPPRHGATVISTAPILGALAAVIFLHEPITTALAAAALLMAFGIWLHLTEVHDHEHEHEPTDHSHSHVHDAHQQHGAKTYR